MNELLQSALNAQGGAGPWRAAKTLVASGRVDGELWGRRGQAGAFSPTTMEADLQSQKLVFRDFKGAGRRGIFTPKRTWIEDADGHVVESRDDPASVLAGQSKTSPWDDLTVLYTGGFDLWAFLLGPLVLTMPGVEVEEIDPIEEAGEEWRRLRARFPDDLVMHATEQTYAFNENGLLRRLDYAPKASGVPANVNYMAGYRPFGEVVVATRRRMQPTNDDGLVLPSPVLMSVDLDAVTLE